MREKTGHALAGARQQIPAEDIAGPVKSLVTGLPLDLRFRTGGQLAIDILDDAYADGLAFDFACGDEVYGSCTELREYLEGQGQAYVKRVFELGEGCFGLDQCQAWLYTAILRHAVLVMAALAICAVTAALVRDRTDAQAPPPARPDALPPADPGLIPLTVREVRRLLAAELDRPKPPGHAARWLQWRRRHQARSRWFHQRARLARNCALVS